MNYAKIRCNPALSMLSFRTILQILCHRIIGSPIGKDLKIHHIQFPMFHKRTPTKTFPSSGPSTLATQIPPVNRNSLPPKTAQLSFKLWL